MLLRMRDLVRLIVWMVVDLFRSWAALEAEILTLRQQINVLRRTAPKKQTFSSIDRLTFVCLYRLGVRDALAIVKPETVVKWHRAGFRSYWRWKSRRRGGRPTVTLEIRRLVREMSIANPLWGAPRIHGELLKLGVDIGQTSVAKYMVRRRDPPSQGWTVAVPAVPGAPGAKVPPLPTATVAVVPLPVSVPPLMVVMPPMEPVLLVTPAVLLRPPLSVPPLLVVPLLTKRPDKVAPALLLKVPAFVTVPIQVRLFVSVPAFEATLPDHVALLVTAPVLPRTLPFHMPPWSLTINPVLLVTLPVHTAWLTPPGLVLTSLSLLTM
jgi:hypothetical protein